MASTIEELFKNPPAIFKGAPFWSLNDVLEDAELIRQIDDMKRVGLGGFFMHSRVGLITEYMSPDWMERIKTCVHRAKEIGVHAWLYDEDRWPSGFAGGAVPARGEKYLKRCLAPNLLDPKDYPEETAGALKIFACKLDGNKLLEYHDITDGADFSLEGYKILAFKVNLAQPTPWFNGYGYVDLLNPQVTQAFIEENYEPYREALSAEFGTTVPGIFTDEPNYITASIPWDAKPLPWTDELPSYFYKLNGYSILDKLPLLYYDCQGCEKTRYDFWRTVARRFREAYGKLLYDWCEEHGIVLTGHYLFEDSLYAQTIAIGAAMPLYEYMQLPGIDHLGRNIDLLMTVKQVSSVAHQLGRERVLSELYGCSGWDLSFEEQKWIGEWEYVLGVNLRCQHLTLYSARGCRKRDFPPSISYHQPWWDYYNIVEDHFARLGYALTRGEFVPKLLLLHPIGSGWANYTPLDNSKINKLNEQFLNVSKWLCEIHYDYDYGDETILAKYGKSEDGKLFVGKMSYSVVLMPPSSTWASSTISLLEEFVNSGGRLICVEPLPSQVDAVPDERIKSLLSKATVITLAKSSLSEVLEKVLPRDASIRAGAEEISDIYYQHRQLPEGDLYFMVNISRENWYKEVEVKLRGEGAVEEWDPTTGDIKELPAQREADNVILKLEFAPTQSHLIFIRKGGAIKGEAAKVELIEEIPLKESWQANPLSPNALTLDYCQVRLREGVWSEKLPIWKAQAKIRAHFGLWDQPHNNYIQFWKAYKDMKVPPVDSKATLRFTFRSEIANLPGDAVKLAVETPERFTIQVNGTVLPKEPSTWWLDRKIGLFPIGELIKPGENEILLQCVVSQDLEFESIYVVGNFTVVKDSEGFILSQPKDILNTGDWVMQGYPFFAGTMEYKQKITLDKQPNARYILEFKDLRCAVLEVIVNGTSIGQLAWHPWRIDITEALKDGENELTIRLTNSLRNLLGPHHHKAGELFGVSAASFCDEENWTDEYNFVPHGLLANPVIKVFR